MIYCNENCCPYVHVMKTGVMFISNSLIKIAFFLEKLKKKHLPGVLTFTPPYG